MARIQDPLCVSRAGMFFALALALGFAPMRASADHQPDHQPEGQAAAAVAPDATVANAPDAAIAAIDAFIAEQHVDKTQADWKSALDKPPKVEFTAAKHYFWNLQTNKGKIKIKLMPEVAPMHVSSTIYLTRLGFYDGTIFHRVIPRFMAQGGDPTGTGRGGPGYKYAGEFDAKVIHDKPGLLSMANAGPGTDGSQFFITFVKTPHLDGKHTLFGRVVEGMDTVGELEKAGTPSGKTKEKLAIETATISVE